MDSKLYASALAQCQLGLAQVLEETKIPLQKSSIEDEVDEVLSLRRFKDGIDRLALIKELEEIFTIWSDTPSSLDNDDDQHQPWLTQRHSEIKWNFWNRYRLYLLNKQKMSPIALENISNVTEQVLGKLEDPQRQGPWDRRGLVMGDVQSGKTGTYVGLICKAADAGYKVIVVLAGLHNNLRSQTQIRLDEGFLGYKAAPPSANGATFEPTGVAEFGRGLKADSVTHRHDNGDFNRNIAQHFAIHPGGHPLLFVVKKHVSVLNHLLGYIHSKADSKDPVTGRKYHRDTSLLILDDEADQASVDTRSMAIDEYGNPDTNHDPTKTNELIRKLLHSFDKSAYVGFTATPFANIFIHERATTEKLGDDLFPRSFIVNLPAPSNYTGAARIFGIKEDKDAGVVGVVGSPIVRPVTDHAASEKPGETEGWMPPKLLAKTGHVPLWEGKRTVPPTLALAIKSFLISSAVRSIREEAPLTNSMLVHVSRFTNVQNIVKSEIEAEVLLIVDRISLGDGSRVPTIQQEFETIWTEDYVETSASMATPYALPSFVDVFTQIQRIASTVVVKAINGSAADVLDYDEHRSTGLNVIAVGGDKLSRGLTLDGLVVSYFLRSSRMYDTLMQMGRWFGYREKYLDICRLFVTTDLQKWFKHIAAATEELRLEFDYMVSVGASPRDFGLKVRSHPVLMITSAAKMRTGTEMQLSYAGAISETIIFDKSEAVRQSNLNSVEALIDALPAEYSGDFKGGYEWSGVPPEPVLEFLAAYSSHEDSRRANAALLSRYIRRQNQQGELTDWTVKLASSSDALGDAVHTSLFGMLKVGAIERAPYPLDQSDTPQRFTIRRLVNPSDEMSDLDEGELAVALERTKLLWEKSTRKNKSPEAPLTPSGQGIRFARPKIRGLLVIYPLDPKNAGLSDDLLFFGVAVSFPESKTAEPIFYTVTNLFTETGDYDDL